MTHCIALEHVLALLRPSDVIAACGIDARERGRAWRLRTCPGCGAKLTGRGMQPSQWGGAIYCRRRDGSWRWTHHGHQGCAGDLLDLVAVTERLDRRRDLPKLLEVAGKIAGITPSDPNLERKIAEQRAIDRARRECEEAERAAAIAAMPERWEALPRRSLIGEHYLKTRGIDPAELRAQGDSVRFSEDGAVAVAMRSLTDDGAILGIQYRVPLEKGFDSEPWSASDESALCGRLAELDRGGVDVAVVVEGLTDTLAARLAFPTCAVFGAAGAGNLENVAEAVAARVVDVGGWMLFVADNDDVGIRHGIEAVRAAQEVGLVLDQNLLLVDLGGHHDLADAYAAGWRWRWPTTPRTA